MANRRERSDIVTQFPGNIELEKQWEETLQTLPWPERTQRHDDQSDICMSRDDADEVAHDMIPPRLPPKLKTAGATFVQQEIGNLGAPLLRRESPWEYYIKACRRELGGSIIVACKKPATFDLFAVKCIIESDVNKNAQVLRQVKHKNFLPCYEIFVSDNAIFTISEYMAISLADLNCSAIPPDEIQIATIVHQVSCLCQIPYKAATKQLGPGGD
jgi:hypothetical protein